MDMKNKKKTVMDETLKRVEKVFNAFKELGKEDTPSILLYEKIKSGYESLEEDEKEGLFRSIVEQIEVPKERIESLVDDIVKCGQNDKRWPRLMADLRVQSYSPRLIFLRKVSHFPGGLKFLLDFRGDLLAAQRYSKFDLTPLDLDIVLLFEMWFQEGFLYLEEITLDSSYRQMELIKNRDFVHPMASIEEMGRRLGKDRRCFTLYHRLLPYEPIIFIEVVLTVGLATNITEIMAGAENGKKRGRVDTAIFYSINNTQNGLAGLGLGKMLIGKVVDYIRQENEKIKTFATLSPVPGFLEGYLRPLLKGKDENFILKHTDVITFFSKKACSRILGNGGTEIPESDQFNRALLDILSQEAWAEDDSLKKALRNALVKIAYHYIANEKNVRNKPLNPVAGFHLGNGATVSMKNINFLGNPLTRGLKESCGIMVNYIYTSSWLSQFRRSFRWIDRMEIKGIFRQRR